MFARQGTNLRVGYVGDHGRREDFVITPKWVDDKGQTIRAFAHHTDGDMTVKVAQIVDWRVAEVSDLGRLRAIEMERAEREPANTALERLTLTYGEVAVAPSGPGRFEVRVTVTRGAKPRAFGGATIEEAATLAERRLTQAAKNAA